MAVWEQGAVPCAVGAAGDPSAAKTLSEGVRSPLQPQRSARGRG